MADDPRRQNTAVLQRHLDVLGVLDDVIVGDHIAIGRDEEAGTLRFSLWRGRLAAAAAVVPTAIAIIAAAVALGRQVGDGEAGNALQLAGGQVGGHLDRDHGRRHLLEYVGEGERRTGRRREDGGRGDRRRRQAMHVHRVRRPADAIAGERGGGDSRRGDADDDAGFQRGHSRIDPCLRAMRNGARTHQSKPMHETQWRQWPGTSFRPS